MSQPTYQNLRLLRLEYLSRKNTKRHCLSCCWRDKTLEGLNSGSGKFKHKSVLPLEDIT